jgi:hypothetical protein
MKLVADAFSHLNVNDKTAHVLQVRAHSTFPGEVTRTQVNMTELQAWNTSEQFCDGLWSGEECLVEKVYYKLQGAKDRKNVQRARDHTYVTFVDNIEQIDADHGLLLYHSASDSAPPSPTQADDDAKQLDAIVWRLPVRPDVAADCKELSIKDLADRFPLLDREVELKLIAVGMLTAIAVAGQDEAERSVPVLCFGGVSGSGKTRLVKESALYFNETVGADTEYVALYARINSKMMKGAKAKDMAWFILDSAVPDCKNDAFKYVMASVLPPLAALAEIINNSHKKFIMIVNLDESQVLHGAKLLELVAMLSGASSSGAIFMPVVTGLNLTQFVDLKTASGRNVQVHPLGAVRDLGRC